MDSHDLKEALTGETEYALKFRGLMLYFTLRNPTNSEDLEYRRRVGKVSAKNGKLESTDVALEAPLWLLEKVKTKVEYSNGTAERFAVPDDLYRDIPNRTKLVIINKHLSDIEGEEAELIKN